MNTKTIVCFYPREVEIIDNTYNDKHNLVDHKRRTHDYSTMTNATFIRLVNLQNCRQATTRLIPWGRLKDIDVLIYWKREKGRI